MLIQLCISCSSAYWSYIKVKDKYFETNLRRFTWNGSRFSPRSINQMKMPSGSRGPTLLNLNSALCTEVINKC